MVLAYEAYIIHYASFSQLANSLFSVGGTVAAFLQAGLVKSDINETRFA